MATKPEELGDLLKALGSYSSPEEVKRMVEELDTVHDGIINLSEFAEFCKGLVTGDDEPSGEGGERELLDAFNLYDQDKDGLISAMELPMALNRYDRDFELF